MGFLTFLSSIFGPPRDIPSPQNWIEYKDIKVNKNTLTINKTLFVHAIANTNSMDPVLDAGHNVLLMEITRPEQLKVGDIISFKRKDARILHRIRKINNDGAWYCMTKGDNARADSTKIRFKDIYYVAVGVIY